MGAFQYYKKLVKNSTEILLKLFHINLLHLAMDLEAIRMFQQPEFFEVNKSFVYMLKNSKDNILFKGDIKQIP